MADAGRIRDVVIDDREAFANRERFPEAAEVLAGEYEEIFPKLPDQRDQLPGDRHARASRRYARAQVGDRHGARYIAMIGSKRKVLNVIRELEKEGIPRATFERIFAPMGLEIGAISPEEIAISVAAEMIAVRRNAASNWRVAVEIGVCGESQRAVLAK